MLQVQLLAEFLKEQDQKQASLKKKRFEHPKVQTVEASVQCESRVVIKQTADASVQTYHYDIVNELKEQIQNLTEVVKQLTAVKCIDQHEPKTPSSPLLEMILTWQWMSSQVSVATPLPGLPRISQNSPRTSANSNPDSFGTVTRLPSSSESTKIAPCVHGSEHPSGIK